MVNNTVTAIELLLHKYVSVRWLGPYAEKAPFCNWFLAFIGRLRTKRMLSQILGESRQILSSSSEGSKTIYSSGAQHYMTLDL